MKISKLMGLNLTQAELDFVDVDVARDKPLFLDPVFIGTRSCPFSQEARKIITDFFQKFIELVKKGKTHDALGLLQHLTEPNETCLGMSRGRPAGRGIGTEKAKLIHNSLINSAAIKTGSATDLEDCRIFVNGVDKDNISDMVTNIIRGHLIEYTANQCRLWGVALRKDTPSGYFWDRKVSKWRNEYREMLVLTGKKYLLVPKAIVSYSERYTMGRYHQNFALEFLRNEHLQMNSSFVHKRTLRNGRVSRRVFKKELKEKIAPATKEFVESFTDKHPDVFAKFKGRARDKAAATSSLPTEEILKEDVAAICRHLRQQLQAIAPGNDGATAYHRCIVAALEIIFYPRLSCPSVEREIHDGRKRIDIVYDNNAQAGIFWRVHEKLQLPAAFIAVECKNYSRDVANPELDQMGGRFSPNRGKVGLVVCRKNMDQKLLIDRCRDTFKDQRGLIIPLADADIDAMLEERERGEQEPGEAMLEQMIREIALS